MEDPWANAWGEPSKPIFSQPSSSNWSAPSVSTIHGDHEDDISTPSWSVEPTTHWDEPNVTESSLWRNELSSTWQPARSTFDTIPLSTVSVPQLQFPTSIPEEPENHVASCSSSDGSPPPSSPISETPPLSLSLPLKPLDLSRPSTPDAFGTFKSADEFEEPAHESWSPAKQTFSLPSADADAWGPSWGESNESNSAEEPGTTDELDYAWETAKQQKQKQDRHVPPELLASILRQLEEMSGELWQPDTDASTSATENERSLGVEIVVPVSIAQIFMPDDMTLPSNIQFTKTFISKQLIEALKLTKHAPQTRFSPMAMYMLSKGSTSWEASIKSQPNITQDDFAPAGWKIVEAVKENTVIDDGKKKATSGLLSFFGRRTTSSQSDTVSRSNSPGPPINNPVVSSLKTGSSPRASADNVRSTATIGSSQGSGRTTPVLPVVVSSSSSISTQKHDSNPTASSLASDSLIREPTPPPSAVSRFLGRFSSRTSKPRDSLALSQDDLEFLSDVPTLNDFESNHNSESDSLSIMIKSPPLPTTLPPPLAPPPRPSQPTWTLPLTQATKLEKDPPDDAPFSIFISSDSASKLTQPLTAAPAPLVGGPLLNSSLSSTPSPLAYSHNSGSTISNQGWSSFGDLSAPANGILSTKRPVVAAPPNISLTPPPVPKLKPKLKPNVTSPVHSPGSPYNQWPRRDSLTSGSISPLPPPPGSLSHTPLHTTSVQAAVNFDDDDFSEFLSSPAQSIPPVPPSFTHDALSMNLTNSSSSVGQTPPTNIFDGLDDFLGSFSPDPQPPPPPAKQKPQPFVLAPNFPPLNNRRTLSTQTPQHSGTVSKADHSRTLSLLENVAAHGQWLGPASPLPEALPPPVSSNVKSSSNDFFQYGSTMQAQQAHAVAARSASLQATTLRADEKNRLRNTSPQLTPAHLLQLPVSSQPSLLKSPILHISSMNPAVTSEVKSGGLSAQDLSFFEGL